ncbi:MAG: hypothetical protein WCF36_11510, partial [Candidatus Nanopelagicales bacterium]
AGLWAAAITPARADLERAFLDLTSDASAGPAATSGRDGPGGPPQPGGIAGTGPQDIQGVAS